MNTQSSVDGNEKRSFAHYYCMYIIYHTEWNDHWTDEGVDDDYGEGEDKVRIVFVKGEH